MTKQILLLALAALVVVGCSGGSSDVAATKPADGEGRPGAGASASSQRPTLD